MISSIILSAGMSSRMGQPKALLDWGGETLLAYQVHQLKEAGVDEVIVVLGDRADEIQRAMKGLPCRTMFNPLHFSGRASSVRIGARAVNRDATAIVIANVDQPRPASLIRAIIEAHKPESAATVPVFNGSRGHPIIVSGRLRDEMLAATDDRQGLRGILEAHASEVVEVPADEIVELDLNTPDDYTAARQRFGLPV